MNKVVFRSVQANTFEAFIIRKRAQGYTYDQQEQLLYRFDCYLIECSYDSLLLTREIIDNYSSTFINCKAYSHSQMLCVVRVYSRFLNLRHPESYVIKMPPSRPPRPSRFYIYSPEEITMLLKAAEKLGSAGSIRPYTIKTLIALLYVCGLRISEALSLNADDLDTEQQTLFIRKGKFSKDRYVPLSASSVKALQRYRQKSQKISRDNALFVSSRGARLSSKTIGNIFRELLLSCEIASRKPWPRLHDLRHTFAVNCLRKWTEEGCDVNARLPVLSTVMGHVKVSCTQVYLHVTAELLCQASERFHNHIKNTITQGE